MGYFQRYGSIKPGPGLAQIDYDHPFSFGLNFAMLFDQAPRPLASGGPFTDMVMNGNSPLLRVTIAGPTPVWANNLEGSALSITDQTTNFTLAPVNPQIWLPSTACTVAFIRRRTNATFNTKVMANSSANMVIYAPFIDGIVYWDYGGSGGANRLSLAGLSFQIVVPERWIFTAGPQGSSFWRDGRKLASQSTSISRTADTASLTFNVTDYNEFNFIQINNVQWNDNLCQWWSASPYEHLYSEVFGNKYFFLGDVVGGITGTLTESISSPNFSLIGSESIIGSISLVTLAPSFDLVGNYNYGSSVVSPTGAIGYNRRYFRSA